MNDRTVRMNSPFDNNRSLTVGEAMRQKKLQEDRSATGEFNPNDIPGKVSENEMLKLLAQNGALKTNRGLGDPIDETQIATVSNKGMPPKPVMQPVPTTPLQKVQNDDDEQASTDILKNAPETVKQTVEPLQRPVSAFDRQTDREAMEPIVLNNPITNDKSPKVFPQSKLTQDDLLKIAQNAEKTDTRAPIKPKFLRRKTASNSAYTRFFPVSGGVFYDGKEIMVRRFNLTDAVALNKASENRDYTAFLDAVQSSLHDFDIRDLTVPDFYQLLYWHRFNSYSSVPFTITWTSKYGNSNSHKILETELQLTPMKLSEEDLKTWLHDGYDYMRLRFQEFMINERDMLHPDDIYLAQRAQWFKGEPDETGEITLENKINILYEKTEDNLDALGKLNTYIELVNHNVKEIVYLKDEKFVPADYIKSLEDQCTTLNTEIETALGNDKNDSGVLLMQMRLSELETEIASLKTKLDNKESVEPDVEEITLTMSPLNFFPRL